MKISKEIKTAILVIFSILLFVFMYSFLKGGNLFSKANTYYTEFNYNALSPSSSVTIKGNKIGKVEDITYDFKTGKTKVFFSVNPELKFSKNSKIKLYEAGLMGGNALAIVQANDTDYAQPGDYIQSIVQKGLMSSLKDNLPEISVELKSTIKSSDTLMNNLNNLVTDESNSGIKATIAELNSTIKSFKSLSISMENLVKANDKKISTMLSDFSEASKNLNTLTTDLKKVELSKTIKKLEGTLNSLQSLVAKATDGNGTIGKLLEDEKLYNTLNATASELQLLLLDIKLHPARYRRILSKREIPYTPPTREQINNNKK